MLRKQACGDGWRVVEDELRSLPAEGARGRLLMMSAFTELTA